MDKTKYKILIIDDEVAILRMLKLAFQSTPYEVEVEEDPEVAYERIKREHFDIVISDIAMPKLDGLTLLRQIKQFNGMIQVIMITGHTTINNALNAFRYGALDLFFKPFNDLNELVKAVDDIATKLARINLILRKVAQKKRVEKE